MYLIKIIILLSLLLVLDIYFLSEVCFCQSSSCVQSFQLLNIRNYPDIQDGYDHKTDTQYCQQDMLTSDMITEWNKNLEIYIFFYQMHNCMTIKNGSYIERNESCFVGVRQHFSYLLNKPLCCQINLSVEHSKCYYSAIDLCRNSNLYNLRPGRNSVANIVCNEQLYKYTECTDNNEMTPTSSSICKQWNKNILSTKYLFFGYLTSVGLPAAARINSVNSSDGTLAKQTRVLVSEL